ncbi:MAG: phosphoribosylaminoimidazolesuccinocarboxamide synthase [Actinobacteria bacterium]|nr:phosphoribosylaminoimidazolesuccinocarboxamide synthase [Actinomycetota bacterium]
MKLVNRGKVRDVYDAGDGQLLMVTSDRMSAFDVVMAKPIPDKGRVLTAMTAWWLEQVSDLAPNHQSGTVHGVAQPPGLQESDRLPEPMFSPSTKAETGHDENLSPDEAAKLVGDDVFQEAQAISLAVYQRAAERAAGRGIIVADTKFELGWIDGRLSLCDEVLTPDSSRFWEAEAWQPGATPPSFDKQPLRDWLEVTGWDKRPPPPDLPEDVVVATADRYRAAYERVTGRSLSDWPGVGRSPSQ